MIRPDVVLVLAWTAALVGEAGIRRWVSRRHARQVLAGLKAKHPTTA